MLPLHLESVILNHSLFLYFDDLLGLILIRFKHVGNSFEVLTLLQTTENYDFTPALVTWEEVSTPSHIEPYFDIYPAEVFSVDHPNVVEVTPLESFKNKIIPPPINYNVATPVLFLKVPHTVAEPPCWLLAHGFYFGAVPTISIHLYQEKRVGRLLKVGWLATEAVNLSVFLRKEQTGPFL